MIDRSVLGLLVMLALAACGDGPGPVRELEPGGGFKAEVQSSVTATLVLPDRVAPAAALIQAELALENKAGDVEIVSVPRACDVFDWVMHDQAGKLVMTKDPVECIDQPVSKALAPGSVLRERISIYLLPDVLRSGSRYVIDYRFWGQPARAEFTARR
ncbi:MAG: hypothetical protein HY060_14385 [Proteobacteria bacterium]|nr:hypothetical protein [Pseudomonadota bacterium]